jgi:hypothetical protein
MTMLRSEVSEVTGGGLDWGGGPYRWWFTPAGLILIPTALSFLAWTLLVVWRSFGSLGASRLELTGFLERAAISVPDITLILVWYGAVVLLSTMGWRLGIDTEPDAEIVARTSAVSFERRYFLLILTAALIGVTYSYYKIGSATSVFDSLTTQTVNSFSNSLSGTAGIETLRYATILAAPISIYLRRKKVIGPIFVLAAVALLLLNTMIASRLALLMAVIVYLAISTTTEDRSTRKNHRLFTRTWKIVATLLIVFAALTALNYVRNGGYYRAAGVSNPISMNMYQMGSYLAVPAQVSLGVSNAVMRGTFEDRGSLVDSMEAVEPSFLVFDKAGIDTGDKNAEAYGFSVSFASNYTTNSVFADTYADYGAWGWLYTLALYPVAGYVFGRLIRYGPVIAGSGGVLAYCLAEVWRIQMLNAGIVMFLVLLTLGCSLGAGSGLTGGRVRFEPAPVAKRKQLISPKSATPNGPV